MNIILAMIPAFLWGSTYAVTQYTLPDWPVLLLGLLRALPAGLILLAIKPMWPNRSQLISLSILGLVNIGIFFSLIFVMAQTLPSAISGVGMVSVPVFSMVFIWLVYKKKPTTVQILSSIGLIILAWILFDPSKLSLERIGLLSLLGAILCLVIGSTMTKSFANKMHWWMVLTWQLIIGGIILTIIFIIKNFNNLDSIKVIYDNLTWLNFVGLFWIIIMNTTIAYALYVWLLQKMSIVDFTFGGIANPIAGILMGSLLLNESFNFTQYLIMAGMIILSLTPQIFQLIKSKMNNPR